MNIGQPTRIFTVIPRPNSEEPREQNSQPEKQKRLPEKLLLEKLDEKVKV